MIRGFGLLLIIEFERRLVSAQWTQLVRTKQDYQEGRNGPVFEYVHAVNYFFIIISLECVQLYRALTEEHSKPARRVFVVLSVAHQDACCSPCWLLLLQTP